MPLTAKGNEIKSAMQKEYGSKKGEEVFYASKNKGTISGVDSTGLNKNTPGCGTVLDAVKAFADKVDCLAKRMDGSNLQKYLEEKGVDKEKATKAQGKQK